MCKPTRLTTFPSGNDIIFKSLPAFSNFYLQVTFVIVELSEEDVFIVELKQLPPPPLSFQLHASRDPVSYCCKDHRGRRLGDLQEDGSLYGGGAEWVSFPITLHPAVPHFELYGRHLDQFSLLCTIKAELCVSTDKGEGHLKLLNLQECSNESFTHASKCTRHN